ncbi:hypothetical protein EG328_009923 [Venturia inaequalis]|uniref:Uncharacterized protein n=1 Tax=Venturia inaequalis TaxID=5025 RepID=A0A8H3U813_VENIN|nr:hypothetical protein EG328_009923 [Venturia inaequalis]RDI83414.1 hypothetical protein Vi05172_g6753 [Venturia inaequalis]
MQTPTNHSITTLQSRLTTLSTTLPTLKTLLLEKSAQQTANETLLANMKKGRRALEREQERMPSGVSRSGALKRLGRVIGEVERRVEAGACEMADYWYFYGEGRREERGFRRELGELVKGRGE